MAERRTPVSGVSGLTLEISDLPAAERFYSEVLGLPFSTWYTSGKIPFGLGPSLP